MFPSNWSIHAESGHCRHPTGIDAYVDLFATDEAWIPLLGLYAENRVPSKVAADLILALEKISPGKTVVFGDLDKKGEARAQLMGMEVEWTPNYGTRSIVLIDAKKPISSLHAEWDVEGVRLCHRLSGAIVEKTAFGVVASSPTDRHFGELTAAASIVLQRLSTNFNPISSTISSAFSSAFKQIAISE